MNINEYIPFLINTLDIIVSMWGGVNILTQKCDGPAAVIEGLI